MGVHLSINLGKKYAIPVKDLFFYFWSSPEFGEKKGSIFHEDLFFFQSSPEFGEKSVLFLMKTFFLFWSSPEFGEKKIFDEDLFFYSPHLNLGKKIFTKFPQLNKIVVEVHPPNVENSLGQNWGKIANYFPNAQQRSAPLIILNDFSPV